VNVNMTFLVKCISVLILFWGSQISIAQMNPSFQEEKDEILEETENRIRKELFFRGEVADYILEKDLLPKITTKKFSTYSQAREYLIFWAEKNPKEAAYFYVGAQKGDPLVYKGKISYVITSGGLKKHFIELVNNLEKIARDGGLKDEEIRLSSARLFEGFVSYGDNSILDVSSSKMENRQSTISNLATNRLNTSALIEEENKLSRINELLMKEAEKYILKESDSSALVLFKKRYAEFIAISSSLKGRKTITQKESKELYYALDSLRRSGLYLFASLMSSKLKIYAQKIESGFLKEIMLELAIEIEKSSAVFQNPDFPFERIAQILKEISQRYDSLLYMFRIYSFSGDVLNKLKCHRFSGWLDWLDYKIKSFFFKENQYFVVEKKIEDLRVNLEMLRKDALNGNIESIMSCSNIFYEANNLIEKKKEISLINAKMQFLAFEIFWPFGLNFGCEKYKIKVNYSAIMPGSLKFL